MEGMTGDDVDDISSSMIPSTYGKVMDSNGVDESSKWASELEESVDGVPIGDHSESLLAAPRIGGSESIGLTNSLVEAPSHWQYGGIQNDDQQETTNNPTTNDDWESAMDSLLPGVNDLPEFASEEAHSIHKDNLEKEEIIEKTIENVADLQDRLRVMKEHFRNVQQEVEHTNNLQSAKRMEIKTEEHLRQLANRALGRNRAESKKLTNEIEFVKEQLNTIQGSIYRANEQLEEFKMQMNWNQEELEQWALAAKQKDEDFLAIEKYRRADEQRIKELTLSLEQLTKEHLQVKLKLENEATDTIAKQMELDRVARDFKVAHNERTSLVNRWQETIAEMRLRDVEINELGERFSRAKADRAKKQEILTHQRKRVVVQQNENRDVDAKTETLSRLVQRKREEMMTMANRLTEFKGELESLKNELTMTAEKLMARRTDNTNRANALTELRVQLERERTKYQLVKQKIEKAKDTNEKAESRAKAAEDDLVQKERELNAEMSRVKVLKERAIKESQQVHELKTEESRLRTDIHGNKLISRNLESQLHQLDKEAARQQELLYNAEFQIQQIERRIARGMGERSDEEKQDLRQRIAQLEENLEAGREKRKILMQQNRRLNNELAQLKVRKEDNASKLARLTEQLGEHELENKMIEEEIRRETRGLEELTVQNDLLLLEVRRLKDLLSVKSDAVFSLENRKQQLALSMEERKNEINAHRELLRAELRALSEDKHRITMELRQRQANVERLKTRFQVQSAPAEGEEKHSQAYYVIKAAQKREELQRRGDQLDQDIRKCEREIRALQTTLDHLNTRNVAYRESFKKVDTTGSEADVLKMLEEKIRLSKDALFRKKKDLQRLLTDLEEDSRRLEQVNQQCEKVNRQRDNLLAAKSQIDEEIATHTASLNDLGEKVTKIVTRHQKKFLENGGDPAKLSSPTTTSGGGATLEEKIVRSEVVRDVLQNVLYTLGQLAAEFPEAADTLTARLQEVDLRLPLKAPNTNAASSSLSAGITTTTGTSSSGQRSSTRNRPMPDGPPSNGSFVQAKTIGLSF